MEQRAVDVLAARFLGDLLFRKPLKVVRVESQKRDMPIDKGYDMIGYDMK